jgi:hypothetical protein
VVLTGSECGVDRFRVWEEGINTLVTSPPPAKPSISETGCSVGYAVALWKNLPNESNLFDNFPGICVP